jgi:hypothetical protein
VQHRGREHNHGGEVDLAAEETHRRWCDATSASLDRATEAETHVVLRAKMLWAAAWLARIVGAVERAVAVRISASLAPRHFCEVSVNLKEEVEKSGVGD